MIEMHYPAKGDCSNYDGNTLFFDKEIIAWTTLPEPTMEGEKR